MGVPRRAGDPAELRKSLKPLLEKRRRARINASLRQLKGLILPLLGRESSHYSKLEKADILEMTVRFLRELPASYRAARTPGERPAPPPTPTPRAALHSPLSRSAAPSDGYGEGYRAYCKTPGALGRPRKLVVSAAVSTPRDQLSTHNQAGTWMFVICVAG
nr:transcription factor HES-2 [Vulpes vulpes]